MSLTICQACENCACKSIKWTPNNILQKGPEFIKKQSEALDKILSEWKGFRRSMDYFDHSDGSVQRQPQIRTIKLSLKKLTHAIESIKSEDLINDPNFGQIKQLAIKVLTLAKKFESLNLQEQKGKVGHLYNHTIFSALTSGFVVSSLILAINKTSYFLATKSIDDLTMRHSYIDSLAGLGAAVSYLGLLILGSGTCRKQKDIIMHDADLVALQIKGAVKDFDETQKLHKTQKLRQAVNQVIVKIKDKRNPDTITTAPAA